MRALVTTPICPLYSHPSQESELSDEIFCGMEVELLEIPRLGWHRVRTAYCYEGYASDLNLLPGNGLACQWASRKKAVVYHKNTCDVMAKPSYRSWVLASLPRGVLLATIEGSPSPEWQKILLPDGRAGFVRSSILAPHKISPISADEPTLRSKLVETALLYRGSPYRWGGKSPLGIDCSGLCSMVYLLCGITIWRDARLKEGFPIHLISPEQMGPGDLLYFPGHMAIYLGNGFYLHSTGKAGSDGVVLNSLDPNSPLYREDLAQSILAIGSYF